MITTQRRNHKLDEIKLVVIVVMNWLARCQLNLLEWIVVREQSSFPKFSLLPLRLEDPTASWCHAPPVKERLHIPRLH